MDGKVQRLAEDVRYYGEWMKQEAFERNGHLYPKVKVPKEQGGGETTVIAWIWARTEVPEPCMDANAINSFILLGKEEKKSVYVEPIIGDNELSYEVKNGKLKQPGR